MQGRFVKLRLLFGFLMLLAATRCGSDNNEDNMLPTIMELPTEEITLITEQPAAMPTVVTTIPPTSTETSTFTHTPHPTSTPLPSIAPTLTPTANPTRAFELSATAAALQAPRISTLTPIPIGADVQPPVYSIPVVAADIVITEQQFQDEINLRINNIPEIQSVLIDFLPGAIPGIRVRLTASGGEVFVIGDVFIGFQLTGGLVAIDVLDISVGSGDPPQAFVDVAQNSLFPLVVDTFDSILTQRLGEQHDLETITITDTTMDIMLLIPE